MRNEELGIRNWERERGKRAGARRGETSGVDEVSKYVNFSECGPSSFIACLQVPARSRNFLIPSMARKPRKSLGFYNWCAHCRDPKTVFQETRGNRALGNPNGVWPQLISIVGLFRW